MLAVVLVCAYYVGLLDAARMSAGVGDIVGLLGEAWPPDFTNLHSWWGPLRDSLAMSVAATALAVLLAIPVALLGARNTSPHPAVYWVARMVLNTLRSVPELIMAIVFVAAVGFGALPGALALGIHSAGMVGKFFAESIEHADDERSAESLGLFEVPKMPDVKQVADDVDVEARRLVSHGAFSGGRRLGR